MPTSRRTTEFVRVGFDDQIFQAQRRGGISRIFVELIPRLRAYGVEPVVLSSATRNLHLIESGMVPAARAPWWGDRAEWISWRATGHPRTTPSPLLALDVMHHTFTHGAYLRAWDGPRVVTIADMTPELLPEYFPLGNPHFAKRRYAEASDALIAISQATADDMARVYSPQLLQKTTVVPVGVSSNFFGRSPYRMTLPERYLLFVGVRTGYKRFDLALEAFAALAGEDPRLHFVVIGGGPLRSNEMRSMDALGVADRIVHLTPADEEMPEIYRRAAVFVFPSLYEGFGIPTAEALASGTPTVLADASVSREVGGDVARYAVPGELDSLVDELRAALTPEAAADAAARGPASVRRFNWDDVARATAAVYRSIA